MDVSFAYFPLSFETPNETFFETLGKHRPEIAREIREIRESFGTESAKTATSGSSLRALRPLRLRLLEAQELAGRT